MRLAVTEQHQGQMRHAYHHGAPGILVSGLVWMAAAFVCYRSGIKPAVWTLLIGGALIHPIGSLIAKLAGRPAKVGKDNALNALALASTVWLILCCAMAYGLFLLQPTLFFPAMMATIGSRYLVLASVYGRRIYWILGLALIAAANAAFFLALPPAVAAGLGGAIEIGVACLVYVKASKP